MRRDDEFGLGLQLPQRREDQPMPLRIKMKLGLVDKNDPLPVLVKAQLAQKKKQFELTGVSRLTSR